MITKSDFLLYLDTPLHLWALKNDRASYKPATSYQQFLQNQAADIEDQAEAYLIAKYAQDAQIERQPSFTAGDFHARADFLLTGKNGQTNLYEVKSSTRVRPDHIIDAAFQTLVIKQHRQLDRIFILHINQSYTRDGPLAPEKLFTQVDVTADVYEQFEKVERLRQEALACTQLPLASVVDLGSGQPILTGCTKPSTCISPELCFNQLPDYPIYQLPRLGKKARELSEMGITSLADIPETYQLSSVQQSHVRAAKGTPQIDYDAIQRFLKSLVFPLHFLDYETFPAGLPILNGYRPYEHVVFQFSLHIVEDAQQEPIQVDYLHNRATDPASELTRELMEHVRPTGSILTWNQSFEKTRNRELGMRLPAQIDFYEDLNERTADLMDVFRKAMYVDRDFKGSSSLKNIVPVLVPDLDYASLEVKKGDDAMMAWRTLVFDQLNESERDLISSQLRAYCAMDTAAMVRIWQELAAITKI